MKRLLLMLRGKCPHDSLQWPLRYEDGIDYQTCGNCGARVKSQVQFGQSRFAPLRPPLSMECR